MRKLFLLLFIAISLTSTSQTKLGLRGGLNLARITFKEFNSPPKPLLTRFNLGTMVEFQLDDDWSIYTGPYYTGKGVRFDSSSIRLNYIELPLQVAYKISANPDKQLIISAGGYLSYGFNGQIGARGSSHPSTKHLHRKSTDEYKRMDFGFNVSFLYEINSQYGLRLDYSRSLMNIHRVGHEKNQVFGVSFFALLKGDKNK